jgi:hypothetical protein
VQWQRQIGSGSFADAQAVQQTADGGYILAGSTGVIGDSSVLVVKLGAAGTVQWQQAYGTGYEDMARSVQQTADGGYAVAGEVSSQSGPGSTQGAALLLKLTSSGTIQWQEQYAPGNGLGGTATSVRQTADGGYILAGSIQLTVEGAPETASWLAKAAPAGAITWQHDYYAVNAGTGLPYPSAFSAVAQAGDGGFVGVGYTDEYHNSDNVWLVKTDANGNVANCTEAHPAVSVAAGAGLTATASSLPVVTPATAGAPVSGTATSASLTTHKDC